METTYISIIPWARHTFATGIYEMGFIRHL